VYCAEAPILILTTLVSSPQIPPPEPSGPSARLIRDGRVHPVPTNVFSLADAANAHEQRETRHTVGTFVLEVVEK